MVTAATYQKVLHFNSDDRLQYLHDNLLILAKEFQWSLQSWAVFANHYHFIAKSPEDPKNLPVFLTKLHIRTAKYVNEKDNQSNRKVWWQYWDSHISYQYSYLARLNYVNQNPVKHGIVSRATDYPWCSAAWFEKTADLSFQKTVSSFKTDKVNVVDNF